jgi:predicted metal-binding protein
MSKTLETLEKELRKMALNNGASVLMPINPDKVVVANWVRLKCQFGCPSYAKKLGCPPYSPKPEDTRKVLDEYTTAYLIGFNGSSIFDTYEIQEIKEVFPKVLKDIRKNIFEMEKHAFLSGYYKSFAFGFCGPCTICDECVVEDGILTCKFATKSRPSMEAAGIDVFKTVRNAGLELEVQKNVNFNDLRMFTLLLIE